MKIVFIYFDKVIVGIAVRSSIRLTLSCILARSQHCSRRLRSHSPTQISDLDVGRRRLSSRIFDIVVYEIDIM